MPSHEEKDRALNESKILDEDTILIHKDADGNYSGSTIKYGKTITAREVKPEDVLVKLLTNDGSVV